MRFSLLFAHLKKSLIPILKNLRLSPLTVISVAALKKPNNSPITFMNIGGHHDKKKNLGKFT